MRRSFSRKRPDANRDGMLTRHVSGYISVRVIRPADRFP